MKFRIRAAVKIRAKELPACPQIKTCLDRHAGICGGTFFIEYMHAAG